MTAAHFHPDPAAARFAAERLRREQLKAQADALRAGTPEAAPRSPKPAPLFPVFQPHHAPVGKLEAIKALGLYRKSVRMRPVISGYTPQKVRKPIVFPHQAGQQLTKLSRDVGREWGQVITSTSSAQLAGGKLDGSQGRNLIRIIEALRKHCYLKVDADGQPAQVREQVVQVVDGEAFCFARGECGMSPSTFYRALKHPLAHVFLRTQKVQRTEADSAARRNVATLFSVSLYEPVMPADLEAAYWSEPVEQGGEFTVPDFNCQVDGTKGRPLLNQKQNAACGKLTVSLQGAESTGQAHQNFLSWIDSAALGSRPGTDKALAGLDDDGLEGCIDRLRAVDPGLWEYATQIAIHHDDPAGCAVAAVGYYKALIHIGVSRVRYWVQRVEKWRLKGQNIQTPGRLLMHHLNREARGLTGFNIRDLGTAVGEFSN